MDTSKRDYDLFVSYSHVDGQWVRNWLLPRLEAAGLRVCIDFRDFDVGVPSLVNLERAVDNSRHTLLVLTPNWVQSEWTDFEVLLTQTTDPSSRQRRLLPLLLQLCQPPRRIALLTYADFTQEDMWEFQLPRILAAARDEIHLSDLGQSLEKLLDESTRLGMQGALKAENVDQSRSILRLNFDHLIGTHTRLFAGREKNLQAILDFVKTNPSGYVFIESLSGYGKTSLLAKLVRDNPSFAYHFISQAYRSYGSDFDPTEMQSLLLNLCEQLEIGIKNLDRSLSPRSRFHSLLHSSPLIGRRVVVIDAVDEVIRHPNYLMGLLPPTLPPRVFIIMSARKLGDRDYLSEIGLRRSDVGLHIDLPGLDRSAIAELLTSAGGLARPLAVSPDFVEKLYQVSNGDPFYLRFLVEDVAQGTITPQNINRTPSGLDEYLDMQLAILDRSAYLPQQRDILGIILEAYAHVSRSDLISMVDGLDGLNFDNVIRDIHRFLLVYNDAYTFCHNRFKEYFASKILRV